jgi:hypothetical protein
MTMSEPFDPFARHRQGSEEPGSEPRPGANTVSSGLTRDLQKLHEWLQNDWKKPTIRARDICRLGPNAIRDRKRAVHLAEILTGHGWLIPNRTRRRNMKEWQIVRGLGGYPTVATVAAAAGADAHFSGPKSSQSSQSL